MGFIGQITPPPPPPAPSYTIQVYKQQIYLTSFPPLHSDFADQFPNASVIGTDISPIQPYWTPPNLQFEIDDATLEWTYKPNSFDYVHMRYLLGSIIDWNALFKQAYKVLKPGAYLESYEASVVEESDDGSVTAGSAMNQWGKLFWEAGKRLGRSFRVYEDELQRKAMEAAGFVDIHVWDFKVGPSYLFWYDHVGRVDFVWFE